MPPTDRLLSEDPTAAVLLSDDPNAAQIEPARTPDRPMGLATIGEMVGDVGMGIAKGAANTAVGLGELVHRIPGVSTAVDALYGQPGLSEAAFPAAREAVRPTNTAQKVGFYGEQMGEFFLPVAGMPGKVGLAANVAKDAVLAGAQSGSGRDAALSGAMSAVVPGGKAVKAGGKWIADQAEPLVRSAMKPAMASLRKITGKGGMDAKANALVRFVIDNKLTTPDKAQRLFQETEGALQRLMAVKNAPTDEPARVLRYLSALESSAAKQRLAGADVAAIRNAAADLLEGSLGQDVVTWAMQPHPTLVDAAGKALMVKVPVTSRAMRPFTMADEALDAARSSGRWQTRKAWGEIKGTDKEIAKTVERAGRDAVKKAIPEAKALLATEGKAIQAEQALDRMAARTGNRDAISLPAHVIAAGEVASGKVPVMAFAANWLRNNQMKAGMWADVLGKAIQKGNAPLVADILERLGVSGVSQMARQGATP